MRDTSVMTGSYNNNSINLAIGSTGDVSIANDSSTTSLINLATSLYSFSQDNTNNNSNVNGLTVNMQTIDTNTTGSTINVYYAIRISVLSISNQSPFISFGNVRISSIKIS